MPFPFSHVCDLFQKLEDDRLKKVNQKGSHVLIKDWFAQHRGRLHQDGVDKCALLSTLLPERRTDRVYSIQNSSLTRIVARALCLGQTRVKELTRWEQSGSGLDLGDCVEQVMTSTHPGTSSNHTVEEIDQVLHNVASCSHFSAPVIRSSRTLSSSKSRSELLWDLYTGLSPRDAKWLTRLISKDLRPIVLDEHLIYSCCHPLLPDILRIQDCFTSALRLLRNLHKSRKVTEEPVAKSTLIQRVKPSIGTKIRQQPWLKARSIRHLMELGVGVMSCEEKIDGEYCQIHVDLSQENGRIQIFSKSGKDSTEDRWALHGLLRTALKFDGPDRLFQSRCILEGEMVVWDEKEKCILAFDEIRKHVRRSGHLIGVDRNNRPSDDHHLMLVLFDVLLIDDESLLPLRHTERIARLEALITPAEGRVVFVRNQRIDFASQHASKELHEIFAACITRKGEGLVFKPDEPYFDFSTKRRRWASSCIKLKQGYVGQLGDIGDFAVIGAYYDAATAKTLQMPNSTWTHFYLGCLLNKDDALRWGEKPRFQVINTVELNPTMLSSFLLYCFPDAVKSEDNEAIDLLLQNNHKHGLQFDVFRNPPVFDVRCFSFHKEGANQHWSLRFPYVSKIHYDRSWSDCMSMAELQKLAAETIGGPVEDDPKEMLQWIKRIDPQGTTDTQQTSTTRTSLSTQSPKKSPLKRPTTVAPKHPWDAAPVLPTPPTSSATEPAKGTETPRKSNDLACQVLHLKRCTDAVSATASKLKKARHCLEPIQTKPAPVRKPLGDISTASSSQDNIRGQARVTKYSRLVKMSDLYKSIIKVKEGREAVPPKEPGPDVKATPVVEFHVVNLEFCAVLLSPCIANMPLLTQSFLVVLKCPVITANYSTWLPIQLVDASTRTLLTREQAENNFNRGQKVNVLRRIILVETRRVVQTAEFLRDTEKKMRQSRREMMRGDGSKIKTVFASLVFDWRLVEALQAAGITPEKKRKLFERWYVGILTDRLFQEGGTVRDEEDGVDGSEEKGGDIGEEKVRAVDVVEGDDEGIDDA